MKTFQRVGVQLVGLAGLVALLRGVELLSVPAAWIVLGVLLLAWAILKTNNGGGDE